MEKKENTQKLKLDNFIKVKQTVIVNGNPCTYYSTCTSKGGSCC